MDTKDIMDLLRLTKDLNFSKVKISDKNSKVLIENINENVNDFIFEENDFSDEKTIEMTSQDSNHEEYVDITSTMVGIYYDSPSPDEVPYIKVGDSIEKDSVVAVIEAMKILTEVVNNNSGVVDKIFVKNGDMVEYGQPLIRLKIKE